MPRETLGLVQGTVDVLILRALIRDAMHGYAISLWIRGRSDGALAVEDAALYQALARLERKGWVEQAALVAFIAVPFVAILAAIPVAWGGWLGWSDVLLSFVFYAVAGHGIARGLLGETAPAMEDLVRARLMDPLSVYPGDRGAASSPAHRLDQYREMNPS